MNEKIKQAFMLLCEQYVKDLNKYENKEIAKDYFYNPKYECGFKIDGKDVYFADILKAFDSMEELIKGKDEYIAKLCNDRTELKEENKNLKIENDRYSKYEEKLEIRMVNDGFVIDILKEFAKSIFKYCLNYQELLVNMTWGNDSDEQRYKQFIKNHIGEKAEDMTFGEWKTIKKVVEKYGKN